MTKQNKEEKKQIDFFNQYKNQYNPELIRNPQYYIREETNSIISKLYDLHSKYVVDFAAGTGRLTIPLLKANFTVLAVDISNKSLDKLKELARELKKIKKLVVRKQLPRKKKFPAIVGSDALHHVKIKKELPLLHKSLSNNGVIVFSEPNPFNISWLIYITLFIGWSTEKGIFQCNYFNLKKRFRETGFKNIKILGFGLFPNSLLNRFPLLFKLNLLLGNLLIFRLFSYRFIITANK